MTPIADRRAVNDYHSRLSSRGDAVLKNLRFIHLLDRHTLNMFFSPEKVCGASANRKYYLTQRRTDRMRGALLVTVSLLGSLLISGGLSNTLAMDINGRYLALGVGSRSCPEYVKYSEKKLENFTDEQYEVADKIIEHWVAGFMTAHNFYVTDTYDVVGTVTIDQIQERIEKYCRANPNKRVAESIALIAEELHKNRIRVDPSKGAPAKIPAK
jgi:hypothetical protein